MSMLSNHPESEQDELEPDERQTSAEDRLPGSSGAVRAHSVVPSSCPELDELEEDSMQPPHGSELDGELKQDEQLASGQAQKEGLGEARINVAQQSLYGLRSKSRAAAEVRPAFTSQQVRQSRSAGKAQPASQQLETAKAAVSRSQAPFDTVSSSTKTRSKSQPPRPQGSTTAAHTVVREKRSSFVEAEERVTQLCLDPFGRRSNAKSTAKAAQAQAESLRKRARSVPAAVSSQPIAGRSSERRAKAANAMAPSNNASSSVVADVPNTAATTASGAAAMTSAQARMAHARAVKLLRLKMKRERKMDMKGVAVAAEQEDIASATGGEDLALGSEADAEMEAVEQMLEFLGTSAPSPDVQMSASQEQEMAPEACMSTALPLDEAGLTEEPMSQEPSLSTRGTSTPADLPTPSLQTSSTPTPPVPTALAASTMLANANSVASASLPCSSAARRPDQHATQSLLEADKTQADVSHAEKEPRHLTIRSPSVQVIADRDRSTSLPIMQLLVSATQSPTGSVSAARSTALFPTNVLNDTAQCSDASPRTCGDFRDNPETSESSDASPRTIGDLLDNPDGFDKDWYYRLAGLSQLSTGKGKQPERSDRSKGNVASRHNDGRMGPATMRQDGTAVQAVVGCVDSMEVIPPVFDPSEYLVIDDADDFFAEPAAKRIDKGKKRTIDAIEVSSGSDEDEGDADRQALNLHTSSSNCSVTSAGRAQSPAAVEEDVDDEAYQALNQAVLGLEGENDPEWQQDDSDDTSSTGGSARVGSSRRIRRSPSKRARQSQGGATSSTKGQRGGSRRFPERHLLRFFSQDSQPALMHTNVQDKRRHSTLLDRHVAGPAPPKPASTRSRSMSDQVHVLPTPSPSQPCPIQLDDEAAASVLQQMRQDEAIMQSEAESIRRSFVRFESAYDRHVANEALLGSFRSGDLGGRMDTFVQRVLRRMRYDVLQMEESVNAKGCDASVGDLTR